MKKTLGIFLIMFMLAIGVGSAHAVSWTMDLSGLNIEASVDGGAWDSTVSFTELMNITNAGLAPTEVEQSFTGGADDTMLDDGDTFEEWGFIKELGVDGNAVVFRDITTQNIVRIYFEFADLTGYIDNYNANTGGPTTLATYDTVIFDDTFDVNFDQYAGTIIAYADSDYDPDNGIIGELASFSLLSGDGNAPDLGSGANPNGDINFTLGFDSVYTGVWEFADSGEAFEDWIPTPGVLGLIDVNAALLPSFSGINPDVGDNGVELLFELEESGTFRVQPIPEPATMLLLGSGLIGLTGLVRRKKN